MIIRMNNKSKMMKSREIVMMVKMINKRNKKKKNPKQSDKKKNQNLNQIQETSLMPQNLNLENGIKKLIKFKKLKNNLKENLMKLILKTA